MPTRGPFLLLLRGGGIELGVSFAITEKRALPLRIVPNGGHRRVPRGQIDLRSPGLSFYRGRYRPTARAAKLLENRKSTKKAAPRPTLRGFGSIWITKDLGFGLISTRAFQRCAGLD